MVRLMSAADQAAVPLEWLAKNERWVEGLFTSFPRPAGAVMTGLQQRMMVKLLTSMAT